MRGRETSHGSIRLARLLITGVVAASLLGSPGQCWSAAKPGGKPAPTLHGTWVIDLERSDNARQKIQQARENSASEMTTGESGGGGPGGRGPGGGGPGGGGPGGGGPGGGGPGGGRPGGGPGGQSGGTGRGGEQSGPDRAQGRGGQQESPQLARLARTAEQLVISGDDSELRITEDDGTPGVIRIQGAEAPKGGTAGVLGTARWKGKKLVSVEPSRGSTKITQTYALSQSGACLTIITKVSGDGTEIPNVKIRRIYTRVKEQ